MPHQGLSDRIKTVIQVELEAGLTPNAIEKANNVSVQTVRKYRRNLHENGSMSIPSPKRMGPPRALSLYIEELISSEFIQNKNITNRIISTYWII